MGGIYKDHCHYLFERDQLGQAVGVDYPTAGASRLDVDVSWSSLGQVDVIKRAGAGVNLVNYTYTGSNVLTRAYEAPATAVQQEYTYDAFGRAGTLKTVQGANTYVDFGYTYDENGNILTQDFNHRTSTPENQYVYDTLDRLTQADYLVGIQTANEEFIYDDLGNRLTLKVDGSVDTTYSHNSANEYTHINSGTPNVSHDAAGNLSADQDGYSYHYDHDNRLTKIRKSGDTVDVATYTYDALGRRIEFIDEVAAVTTRYYYDGWRVLTETDETDAVQRDYIYGDYIDEVLVKVEAGADIYYAHDHLFSVVALMDDTGAVIERYEYDAYGKVAVSDADYSNPRDKSNYANPYTFTGRRLEYMDNDFKPLMYYRNRYYDTEAERLLSRDPYGVQDAISRIEIWDSGEVYFTLRDDLFGQYDDGMNIYEYVGSEPVGYVDTQGLGRQRPRGDRPQPPKPDPYTPKQRKICEGVCKDKKSRSGCKHNCGRQYSACMRNCADMFKPKKPKPRGPDLLDCFNDCIEQYPGLIGYAVAHGALAVPVKKDVRLPGQKRGVHAVEKLRRFCPSCVRPNQITMKAVGKASGALFIIEGTALAGVEVACVCRCLGNK